jgi:integral membrane sensor domain MASE1
MLRTLPDIGPAELPNWNRAPFRKQFLLAIIFLAAFLLLDGSSTASQAWEGAPTCYWPVGLILALLLWGGLRYSPLILVCSLFAAVVNYHRPIISWAGIPGSAMIYLAYIGGAVLLRGRWRIDPRLGTIRDVGKFLLIFLGAAILSAPVGILAVLADGLVHRSDAVRAALDWLASDAVSIVTFTPFMLLHVAPKVGSWLTAETGIRHLVSKRRAPSMFEILEIAAQGGTILAAIWLVFGWAPAIPYQPLYLLFIPVVWVAVRRGLPGATIASFAINLGMTFAALVRAGAWRINAAIPTRHVGPRVNQPLPGISRHRTPADRIRPEIENRVSAGAGKLHHRWDSSGGRPRPKADA